MEELKEEEDDDVDFGLLSPFSEEWGVEALHASGQLLCRVEFRSMES